MLIILLLCVSFFFSGVESAFLTSNKLHIELQRRQGKWIGRLLSGFVNNPAQFLSTILIGNTLALSLYGYYMIDWLNKQQMERFPGLEAYPMLLLIIQSLLAALLVLTVAEFIPKNLFMIQPNFFLAVFIVPILAVYYVLFPVIRVVVYCSHFLLEKVLRVPFSRKKPMFHLDDLGEYIKKLAPVGVNAAQKNVIDTRIFKNALAFKRVKVRDCMIPRTEIVALEQKEGKIPLQEAFLQHNHSRIPIYEENIDNIIGYCHVLSLIHKAQQGDNALPDIFPVLITTETNTANKLMVEMLKKKKGIAIVVDEYGGTSGMVTLEDIIEEIFGEIHDEYDQNRLTSQKLRGNAYLLSARLDITDINEQHDLELPTGEYDTLGGLVLEANGSIPEVGESIQIGSYLLRIHSKDDHRIREVELEVTNAAP